MKPMKLFLAFAAAALGIAVAASSYKVMIPSDMSASDTPLKAGSYKVQIEGNQAVFTHGKDALKVAATVEQAKQKFSDTTLEASGAKLQAIDIGGTTTRIVFK
jgi:hypothetical protein